METLVIWGLPTAITGLIVWLLKRSINKRDEVIDQREANMERLMMMIMQTSRATYVLSEATARAVQRIPDAHCNGDMTEALHMAEKIQKEEQQFLIDQGVKHIFGE